MKGTVVYASENITEQLGPQLVSVCSKVTGNWALVTVIPVRAVTYPMRLGISMLSMDALRCYSVCWWAQPDACLWAGVISSRGSLL